MLPTICFPFSTFTLRVLSMKLLRQEKVQFHTKCNSVIELLPLLSVSVAVVKFIYSSKVYQPFNYPMLIPVTFHHANNIFFAKKLYYQKSLFHPLFFSAGFKRVALEKAKK
jgi:hypothetical protein